MSNIKISDEGYLEFKSFLDSNYLYSYNLVISYMGRKCSGPVFNIDIGDPKAGDIVETVKDINFIMSKDLINEYGGFEILSNGENNGDGLILKPLIAPVSNCNICPGC